MTREDVDIRRLSDVPLSLPEDQIWRMAGVRRQGGELRPALRVAGEEARERARGLLHPQALWRTLAVDRLDAEGATLEGGYQFSSTTLNPAFSGADSVAVALVSIGGDLEAEARRLLEEGDYLQGMLLDAIGSVAVGEVTERVRGEIALEGAATGRAITRSLAPGWQCWPLEDQGVIFSLLPAADIGVDINPSCLMIPEKSETFVVGLGQGVKHRHEPGVGCRFCDRMDCAFRRSEGQ